MPVVPGIATGVELFPEIETLMADGSADFITPAGPHVVGQKVRIAMSGAKELSGLHVQLRIFPDGEERLISLAHEIRENRTWWWGEVTLTCCPFRYRFGIQTSRQVLWLNASGLHAVMPPAEEDFRLVPGFQPPEWVFSSVFYQIFPDRFFCGRPETARAPRPISPAFEKAVVKQWDEPLGKRNYGNEFYGGDLWGIAEKLEYLDLLGVNALYLTPVFTAASNHRYDVMSYGEVDPFLGGNEALVHLAKKVHDRGWYYILDGVFNHTGVNHIWFQDAVKNPESPYREFFTFSQYPEQYVSWLGHKMLPKLDYASVSVCQELIEGSSSVCRRWLKAPFHADGWRLDAPNMLGRDGTDAGNKEIWRDFRKAVKTERSDAYFMGECFPEATAWLQGDTFDGVMNYKGFTIPVLQWLTGKDLHLRPAAIDGQSLVHWLTAMMARVPFVLRNLQYNCLSSHDIARFVSRVKDGEAWYRLALLFQMAFPGVPALYYGEEIGLEGVKDPDNRRPMPWAQISTAPGPLFSLVARVVRQRRALKVLQQGAMRFLLAESDVVAWSRWLKNDLLIAVFNRSPRALEACIPVKGLGCQKDGTCSLVESTGEDLETSFRVKDGELIVPMKPLSGVWLRWT